MKTILYIIIGMLCSFFLFPFSFTFLPSLNMKMVVASVGVVFFLLENLSQGGLFFKKELLIALVLAVMFSLTCYFSAEYNGTGDYSYASYIFSALTWLFAAYAIIALLRKVHGRASFRLLTYYFVAVCMFQCIMAILIDNVAIVKSVVDTYIFQGKEFLEKVDRLYGIGAQLDSGGIRFGLVLVMLASVVCGHKEVQKNRWLIFYLLFSFVIILGLGNMISRTTTVGGIFALLIMALSTGLERLLIKRHMVKTYNTLLLVLLIVIPIAIYLYNTNDFFYEQFRFAFEGFFNWVENGKWETGSTNKLNEEMWVWPVDIQTWIIGTGKFGLFVFSTDVGYCRFILYCGLIGFGIFAIFLTYSPFVLYKKFKPYKLAFLSFALLTFVYWIKVATDIFFIYALFYWIEEEEEALDHIDEEDYYDEEDEENIDIDEEANEDSLLHSRYL